MASIRHGALSGMFAVCIAGTPLFAQGSSVIDAGLSAVRFTDESASVAGPWARWSLGRETIHTKLSSSATGILSTAGLGGAVDGSANVRRRLNALWAADVDGELASMFGSSRRKVSSATAAARLARAIDHGGGWARTGATLSQRELGAVWGRLIEVGAWRQVGRASVTASVTRVWATAQLFDDFSGSAIAVVPATYTEGVAGLRARYAMADVSLSAGLRIDPEALRPLEPIMNATALFWQSDRRAFVFNVSYQPPDFMRGADAAQSISVGMRFNERSPAAAIALTTRPIVQLSHAGGVSTLRVRAPSAKRVEIRGSFTDWEPVELRREGELFVVPMTMRAGTHRLMLRVDGGEWTTAANTPAVDDDLGGRVGLFVVP